MWLTLFLLCIGIAMSEQKEHVGISGFVPRYGPEYWEHQERMNKIYAEMAYAQINKRDDSSIYLAITVFAAALIILALAL